MGARAGSAELSAPRQLLGRSNRSDGATFNFIDNRSLHFSREIRIGPERFFGGFATLTD
jgi:hypothetical protein